ncbi:MAG: dienelactone hydrolase family protein [Dehalococcoidia bacterium]
MTGTPELGKFERYLVEEFYDDYRAGTLPRRAFFRRVAYITGGMAAAAAALAAMGCTGPDLPDPTATIPPASPTLTGTPTTTPQPTPAGTVVPVPGAKSPLSVPDGDPAVRGRDVTFDSGSAQAGGYLVLPAAATQAKRAAVLVCHENAGLTPHIRDVARRFAKEGYAALAVDLLTREGGTAAVERDRVPGTLTGAGTDRHVGDFAAARRYLGTVEGVDGARVGMVGYCFGGGVTWAAATRIPELKAVVPYYGPAPDAAAVSAIKAAAFGVYAEKDARITGGMEALERALTTASVTHQMKVYPGVGHAFHNDTGGAYDETQATQAWKDTLAWFTRHL